MKKSERLQRKTLIKTQRVWIRLTRACNNHCMFCLDQDAQNNSFISKTKVVNTLQKALPLLKVKRVVLSGGEPTIHPDFLEIIKLSKKMGYEHIQVITNGRMFSYKSFLEETIDSGLKEITFSFHGHNAKTHDRLTQAEGSFYEALAGLRNALHFKQKNLIISIDIVLNKLNVKYLYHMLKFFMHLGVFEFDLLQIIPFGRAWNNKELLFYDFENAQCFLKKAFTLAKSKNAHIWTNRFPAHHLIGFEYLMQDSDKLYDEIGGREKIFNNFLKKGIIMPCKGERCLFCFLSKFCEDLESFYFKKFLKSQALPSCLNTRKDIKFEKKVLKFNKSSFTIFDFLDFYIPYRYFLKPQHCVQCIQHDDCPGMQYDFLKQEGFKTIVPITKTIR
ncbi:MAG: radical SAM protein [Candidatus Omnitrophota bacterium]